MSNLKNKLESLNHQFQAKTVETENEKTVNEVFAAVAKECIQQLDKLEYLIQKTSLKSLGLKYQSAQESIITDISPLLEELIELPIKLLKSKRLYEEFDELIADLDDWIESINEEINMQEEIFSYMEAWDIGVFFE